MKKRSNYITKKQAQDLLDEIIICAASKNKCVSNYVRDAGVNPTFCSSLKEVINGNANMRDNTYNVSKVKILGDVNNLYSDKQIEDIKGNQRKDVMLLLTFEVEISDYSAIVELIGEPIEKRFK